MKEKESLDKGSYYHRNTAPRNKSTKINAKKEEKCYLTKNFKVVSGDVENYLGSYFAYAILKAAKIPFSQVLDKNKLEDVQEGKFVPVAFNEILKKLDLPPVVLSDGFVSLTTLMSNSLVSERSPLVKFVKTYQFPERFTVRLQEIKGSFIFIRNLKEAVDNCTYLCASLYYDDYYLIKMNNWLPAVSLADKNNDSEKKS